jgi:hypothetical protein
VRKASPFDLQVVNFLEVLSPVQCPGNDATRFNTSEVTQHCSRADARHAASITIRKFLDERVERSIYGTCEARASKFIPRLLRRSALPDKTSKRPMREAARQIAPTTPPLLRTRTRLAVSFDPNRDGEHNLEKRGSNIPTALRICLHR